MLCRFDSKFYARRDRLSERQERLGEVEAEEDGNEKDQIQLGLQHEPGTTSRHPTTFSYDDNFMAEREEVYRQRRKRIQESVVTISTDFMVKC